jgi:hypothetical protein
LANRLPRLVDRGAELVLGQAASGADRRQPAAKGRRGCPRYLSLPLGADPNTAVCGRTGLSPLYTGRRKMILAAQRRPTNFRSRPSAPTGCARIEGFE